MNTILMFWNEGPTVALSPPEIYRELTFGEEVPGLIDLPVKDILDRLKSAFPSHNEQPGQLDVQTESGTFGVTWTWQYIRAECRDLNDDDRQLVIDTVGLPPYDAALELRQQDGD